MPKHKTAIHGCISFQGRQFKAGDEEAFDQAVGEAVAGGLDESRAQEMIVRLVKKGVLTGVDVPEAETDAPSEGSTKKPRGGKTAKDETKDQDKNEGE